MTMKKYLLPILITILSFSLLSCGDNASEDGADGNSKTLKERRYSIRSAIVEYDISGSQEGSKTIYFDDWGMRQAEESNTTITVGEFSKTANLLSITVGEWQYTINQDTKTGTKSKSQLLEIKEELEGQKYFGELGEQMLIKMGGQKIGEERFMDKDCVVYNFKNLRMKAWYWNWILLKSETSSGPVNITVTARSLKENVSIPKEVFAVPEGVTLNVIDIDNIEQKMREEEKSKEPKEQ